ncbi:Flocculin type 3 repeat [Yamadazyma tenuis]|uniref:Uncharacterized protein n=1 Tax=Candida tenuis (strain ATCC 10573 / BCRC 21748 / CBS 615 / JCM 9827 / NBRC 10315 / NRRL Y-1498 / VKM Y-70) TaxID=590646 RepID=G3BAZ4_CANTC|nr:uncharacterized protein CANTEDRAFT_131052 [Yamadazyma tenuis ATCC 10573]EGV61489.1 hypothetical protein CANTEDRAFT_131052 [Yamadazyma tenuis ATCC 10573]WEJ92705.1 Flocculin type 3 repeat [Yamadazyma tenuis]
MKFSSAIVAAAVAVPALGAYTNSTSTVTDIATTVVTITSCSENKCATSVATTGLTTVTENDTIYTTYCPLTAETATETDISTTVVTITSCSDHKCATSVATTGVTTVTENDTVYTTYCPLTSAAATKAASSAAPTTLAAQSVAASSAASVASFEGAALANQVPAFGALLAAAAILY